MATDALEKAFLAELEALEKFRISYTGRYPAVPLAREDPDVRRLIEAMAMFTARTRLAAERNVGQSMLRLFRQHFPYLLSPVPAAAMLTGRVTRRYVDVAELPSDSEVLLIRRAKGDEPESTYRFRTRGRMRMLPIVLDAIDVFRTKSRGYKLLFQFVAGFARNDEVGEVSLYVNHLNDLYSSLTVLYELKTHLRSASYVFDKKVAEDTPTSPCEVRFGAKAPDSQDLDALEHPLQRARAFLHNPREDMYMHARNLRAPRNWKSFTLCLDVDESWPAELRLSPDSFFLDVVPIVNLRKDTADPIEHDATRERHLVRHPDVASKYVIHSLAGVYRTTKEGLVPLEPAVTGTTRASYDATTEGKDETRRAWITLDLPGAFEEPERVVVDALWHQPSLRDVASGDLQVRLADRFVDGIEWSCAGPLVGHIDADLDDDRDGLLQLVSIKNQRFLSRDDLAFLLRSIGAGRERTFSKLVGAIEKVDVTSKPFARKSAGFKYVYDVSFRDLDATDLPRLDPFCRCLLSILAAWSVEEVVELVVHVPNLERRFTFT